MSKYKLANVEKVIEQIAASGIDFLLAAAQAGDIKMEVYKQSVFMSQAEVAAALVKSLVAAVQLDEAALAASIPDPSLN